MDDYVRRGQNSRVLKMPAEPKDLELYGVLFCRLLGSVYRNLKSGAPRHFDGLICFPCFFGDVPATDIESLDGETLRTLHIVRDAADRLRTFRIIRIYDENVMLIVKPDRLRYWIPSTAIRDADETLVDLFGQGY